MASLDDDFDGDDNGNSNGSEEGGTETSAHPPRETGETQIGNASAAAPAQAPRMDKDKKARTRAGRGTASNDSSKTDESEDEEPFRLPKHIFDSVVAEATRDAADKAKHLVLEDVGFSRHLIQETAKAVMEHCKEAAKAKQAEQTERTPTQAAVLEAENPAQEVLEAELVDETTTSQKNTTTETATPEPKKAGDGSNSILIIVIMVIIAFLLWFAFWPSSPSEPDEDRATDETSEPQTSDSVATSAAQPIAASTGPTPEAIEAFAARAPYSLSERLIALRQLRGTGSEDVRDVDCEGSGINLATRTYIERTVNGIRDSRQLSQSEAQAYFADTTHTGQLTVDAEGGPRHYTVYFDLRDRAGETGHCELLIGN